MFPTLDDLARELPDTPEVYRFLSKVEDGPTPAHDPALGPCLLWNRAFDTSGYGIFRSASTPEGLDGKGKLVTAHLWLFRKRGGVIPPGHELDHLCHVPKLCQVPAKECPHRPCVLHTLARPRAENQLRSNNFIAINAAKTRCTGEFAPRLADGTIIGHDLTDPANVYLTPKTGERKCRPCQRERDRLWHAKKRLLRAQATAGGLPPAGQLSLLDL